MLIRLLTYAALVSVPSTSILARGQNCRQTEIYSAGAAATANTLHLLAFGTSLMWGNGLRPAETLRHLVADSVAQQSERPVQLTTYAHSGALLTSASLTGSIPVNPALDIGAINQALPSVDDQVNCAVEDRLTEASLILVEGCINDVGAETIVYPWTESDRIKRETEKWCRHMSETLDLIDKNFPAARVVVVGYYPILSRETPFLGWFMNWRLTKHATEIYEGKYPQASGFARQKRTRRQSREAVRDNSHQFYEGSKRALQNAVSEQNTKGSTRFAYAGLPEVTQADGTVTVDPDFAFGASKRKQWLIPLRLLPFWVIFKDHTYWPRQKLCRKYVQGAIDELVCQSNSAAHPNVEGEGLYAASVLRAIPLTTMETWRNASKSSFASMIR